MLSSTLRQSCRRIGSNWKEAGKSPQLPLLIGNVRAPLKHASGIRYNELKIRTLCTSKDFKDNAKPDVNKEKKNEESASQIHHSPPVDPVPHHKAETLVGAASNLTHAVGTNIASTFHFTQAKYEEIEKSVMNSIHAKNQRRFRLIVLSAVLAIFWIIAVFGTQLRKYFTEQTAGLAKETLENESLKIQTQELATAVVQTILEDKDITNHAATFLKEASTAPETQQALLKLTMHILQHQETLDELTKLSQKLIKNLANDKVRAVCLCFLCCL